MIKTHRVIGRYTCPIEVRIWVKSALAPSGCIEFTGGLVGNGYGGIGTHHERVHRISWRVAKGPIPAGMHVLHKCDNRKCLRLEHLFLGTHADNMADMVAKGRTGPRYGGRALGSIGQRGEKSPNAKITAAQALAIFLDTRVQRVIADDYNINNMTVSDIKTGATWFDVTGAPRKIRIRRARQTALP